MGYNPSQFKGLTHPVDSVSWDVCQIFLQHLNKIAPAGWRFTLPTEAQWEYACRAGTTSTFNTGNKQSKRNAVFGRRKTANVKYGKPNLWGIYDMHGSIEEWCSDWYQSRYSNKKVDPTGPPEGRYKVLRGGDWWSFDVKYCRSAVRYYNLPYAKFNDYGFRIIMEHTPVLD